MKKKELFTKKCERCGTINHSSYGYPSCYSCSNRPERLNPETLDKDKDDEVGKYYLSNIRITEMR